MPVVVRCEQSEAVSLVVHQNVRGCERSGPESVCSPCHDKVRAIERHPVWRFRSSRSCVLLVPLELVEAPVAGCQQVPVAESRDAAPGLVLLQPIPVEAGHEVVGVRPIILLSVLRSADWVTLGSTHPTITSTSAGTAAFRKNGPSANGTRRISPPASATRAWSAADTVPPGDAWRDTGRGREDRTERPHHIQKVAPRRDTSRSASTA